MPDREGSPLLIGINSDRAWHILERAVARGISGKDAVAIARIGVYERTFCKGHRYMTTVSDIDRGTIDFLTEGRQNASLSAYFSTRQPQQITAIESMTIAGDPYIQATLAAVPVAASKIVCDRFHIMKHMTDAVDVVRRHGNSSLV